MQLLTECVKCSEKFLVSNDDIKHVMAKVADEDVKMFYPEEYKLTYYVCPHCGKKHYVQVDSKLTSQLLVRSTRDYVEYAVAKRKGKKTNGVNQRNRYMLQKERQKLEEALHGKEFIVDGEVEKVVFVHGNQKIYRM